jgi:hypothetical protein
MTTIQIILLGDTYPLSIDKLKKLINKSAIFSIETELQIHNSELLSANVFKPLTDNEISHLSINDSLSTLSIVIVNRPLEANYFSRPISERLIAVSIHDLESLNMHEGITLEMYLSRFIYGFATIYKAFNNRLPTSLEMMQSKLMQDGRGCLFDKCMYKPQVALFFKQPKLSIEAIAVLRTKALPINFIETLNKEIKRLRIGKYYVIRDWSKSNPVTAIILTFLIGFVFSELLGNFVYDLILKMFGK